MDTRDIKSLCEQAKPHYYDMLCGTNGEVIPDYIAFHVQQCWYCQRQMDGLKRILSPVSGKTDSAMADAAAITDVLRLHMAYVGKEVSCRIVKPFIPGMLIPSLEVRVPTPITAHFDKCSKCAQDLEMLRNLNLSRRQLRRLSEFFTEGPCGCSAPDDERQKAAKQFANLDWKNLDSETMRHLCKCPQCRDLVYNQRQKMLDSLTAAGQDDKIACEAILTGGFFDFIFPYGLEAADESYASFRQTFVSHIKDCPDCVSRMQQLHGIIYQIVERPDSGVITVFSQETAAVGEPLESCDIAYEDYPVKVDVVDEPLEPAVVNLADVKKRKRLSLGFKLKAGVAAAILLTISLTAYFHNTAVAELTPGEKMYSALRKTTNIHSMQFVPHKQKPIQEQWVSRKLGIFRVIDKRHSAIYDIRKKIGKSKYFDTGEVEVWPLAGEELAAKKELIAGHKKQLLHQLLSDTRLTEWSRLDSSGLASVPEGVEVYERNWRNENSNGTAVFNKWRIFVDRDTFIPQRTESYQKNPDDSDYVLSSYYVYEYPSDEEFKAVIDDTSF